MKKRIMIFFVLSLVFVGSFVCCANNNPEENSDSKAVGTNENTGRDIGYSVQLAKSEYSLDDTEIIVVFVGKEKGQSIIRSDKWRLYKVDGESEELVGRSDIEIVVEMPAPSGNECVNSKVSVSLASLGVERFESGEYRLEFIGEMPDAGGTNREVPFASMTFNVG